MSTRLNYRLPRYLIKQHSGCFPEGDEGCCCSVAQSCPTLCDPMDCSISVLSVLYHLPKFARIHVHCISDAIQPPHPLMLSSPSALSFPQHQGFFQWVSYLTSDDKNTGVSASASAFLRSIQGWFPLRLTGCVQGTLRSLFQNLSSKASVLSHSAFFMIQLSQPYVTTGKTIALTMWIFVSAFQHTV